MYTRWHGVPFIPELNAKGVILQAFEEYRLRSCVDFKPYEGESSYVSFTKLSGWVPEVLRNSVGSCCKVTNKLYDVDILWQNAS